MAASSTRITRILLSALVVVVVACAAYFPYHSQQHKINHLNQQVSSLQAQLNAASKQAAPATTTTQPTTAYTSAKGVKVVVYAPVANSAITSPLGVVGEVPGNWSFEASFPVVLKDSAGKTVASGTAQVLGDWMTDSLVPFSAKLTYSGSPTGSGTLELQKDNPSGLDKNADTVTVPVKF